MVTTDEIKDLVSIQDVLSRIYGLEVKQRMPCPIHGGTDNNFSVKEKSYVCFSCGSSGDIFNLVQEISHISFLEAKRVICDTFGIKTTHTSKEEQKSLRIKLQRIKEEQEKKKELKRIRTYQQARICQALRQVRTVEGDSFPEKHLEALLTRFEEKEDFFITHSIEAHTQSILNRYKTN